MGDRPCIPVHPLPLPVAAATKAPREVRTFCGVLHATGCRIPEALAPTAERVDPAGRVVVFESLKKRRRDVYRAVPVPPAQLEGRLERRAHAPDHRQPGSCVNPGSGDHPRLSGGLGSVDWRKRADPVTPPHRRGALSDPDVIRVEAYIASKEVPSQRL